MFLFCLLRLLEQALKGEWVEEVALTLVELGLELHPVQPEHRIYNSYLKNKKKLNFISE